MENKTHYRKVFKSDHLGIADLEEFIEEGRRLVFTIKEVKQYIYDGNKNSGVVVAGKRISANIAYFTDAKIKPLVLNSTNSKTVKQFAGNSPFVENWKNIPIELYIDSTVKMKSDVVGGIRIKPLQPTIIKPELTPTHKQWEAAKEAIKNGANKESISKHWLITNENYKLLCL